MEEIITCSLCVRDNSDSNIAQKKKKNCIIVQDVSSKRLDCVALDQLILVLTLTLTLLTLAREVSRS